MAVSGNHRIVGAAMLVAVALSACSMHSLENDWPEPNAAEVDQIQLGPEAFSGSSVNVVAGTRQMLFTHGGYQYAGYYDPEGRVILAKRSLGSSHWQRTPTPFFANTRDAHNSISLIVDGEGYLHLAWGHHDSPLSYSVSDAPGSLAMTDPVEMVGSDEDKVTYPQFFRLSTGDLLFVYRDGASGRGKVVLNHYDAQRQHWIRRQDNLIDGEGMRSAYWDMVVGPDDTLHLAWVWRESPDVATNHDLLYAESVDGGDTWRRRDGTRYRLPITQRSAEVAHAIEQNSNLMNPPVVAVSANGVPFVTSYWSENPGDNPGFNIVYPSSEGWKIVAGPKAAQPFTLAGGGTKKPPLSRAVLLVESADRIHLVYRSDLHGGRVVGATLANLSGAEWRYRYLTANSVGAWEPSIDPAQWSGNQQAHMLLQRVAQVDGDDAVGKQQGATAIHVLKWRPQ